MSMLFGFCSLCMFRFIFISLLGMIVFGCYRAVMYSLFFFWLEVCMLVIVYVWEIKGLNRVAILIQIRATSSNVGGCVCLGN